MKKEKVIEKVTAVAYIRVSTQGQVEDGFSLENQKADIEKYCEYQNYDLQKVFRDEGISGSEMTKRDGLKEAIEYCKENKVDYLIVWKLSRLSRSLLDITQILNNLEKNNIELYVLKDNIDTKSAMGKPFIYLSGIFAELELENMKVQIRGGMRQRARTGAWNGGPSPLGYDVSDSKLIINEKESKIIKYIFKEYIGGSGYLTIAKMLDEKGIKTKKGCDFSANGIRFILMNKTYCGLMEWKDTEIETILVEGEQEAIIDRETFDRVQNRIASKPISHPKNWRTNHLLSGIVKCEVCGASMSNARVTSKGKQYHYYQCNDYSNKKICKPNMIQKGNAEQEFKKEFKEIVNQEHIRSRVVAKVLKGQSETSLLDVVIERKEEELRVLRENQKNLIDTLSESFSKESKGAIVQSMNNISKNIKITEEELEIELKKKEEKEKNKLSNRDINYILKNFDNLLDVIDEIDARQIVLSMIEKVETEDKKISKIETRYSKVYEVNKDM